MEKELYNVKRVERDVKKKIVVRYKRTYYSGMEFEMYRFCVENRRSRKNFIQEGLKIEKQ